MSVSSLQEAIEGSTKKWQKDMKSLFTNAKDRFPDVVWDIVDETDTDDSSWVGILSERSIDGNDDDTEIWGHKAIVYARAPPRFQSKYFWLRDTQSSSSMFHLEDDTDHGSIDRPTSVLSDSIETDSISSSPYQLRRLGVSISDHSLLPLELEYLYTGQGLGDAFEFLFEGEVEAHVDLLPIDKLRKDLAFMWRSNLYSDMKLAITGDFSVNESLQEDSKSTTAVFNVHRFMMVSRSQYFHSRLCDPPTSPVGNSDVWDITIGDSDNLPVLHLPSPPFGPASLHFTLGYIYTGTLLFSPRTYDLTTAFEILRGSFYLDIQALHEEMQARMVEEMLHGLFHAFLPFEEYEKLTGGKWGVGGCRCRQCARRVPRVLEFSLAEDVKNVHLERGSRRALVGLFGEGWCHPEFASLSPKLRESLLKGLAKKTTPQNVWPLLWAVEHALVKLGPVIEPWADVVKENLFSARKTIDETICRESEVCFGIDEWMEIMENEGAGFEDGQKVEWAMAAVLRGVKDSYAAVLYQTLVASILLRPHPTEDDQPLLSATSHIRVQVEQTRLELLKWIGKRWIGIRQEQGFDILEGWALKEISDCIEVPVDDMFNLRRRTNANASKTGREPLQRSPPPHKAQSTLSKTTSRHPRTSRSDASSVASREPRETSARHKEATRIPTAGRSQARISTHIEQEMERNVDGNNITIPVKTIAGDGRVFGKSRASRSDQELPLVDDLSGSSRSTAQRNSINKPLRPEDSGSSSKDHLERTHAVSEVPETGTAPIVAANRPQLNPLIPNEEVVALTSTIQCEPRQVEHSDIGDYHSAVNLPRSSAPATINLVWVSRTLQVIRDIPPNSTAQEIQRWFEDDSRYLASVTNHFPRAHQYSVASLTGSILPRLHLLYMGYTLSKSHLDVHSMSKTAASLSSTGGATVEALLRYESHRRELISLFELHSQELQFQEAVHKIMAADFQHLGACVLRILLSKTSRNDFLTPGPILGSREQQIIDLLHSVAGIDKLKTYQPMLMYSLLKYAKRTGLFPKSLVHDDVTLEGTGYVAEGSFGDVWRGRLRHREPVAVKMVRVFRSSERMLQIYSREAIMWSQLNHPNIMPFYGVYIWRPHPESDTSRVCLLSPWMDHGNVLEFLQKKPKANKISMLLDVARGLQYLHNMNPPVVHGDLKGNNILVTPSGNACLTDFGLSSIAFDKTAQSTPLYSQIGGNELFCAPEILSDSSPIMEGGPTVCSDVYSFGCVVYQIYTGTARFGNIAAMWPRLRAVTENRPVPQPTNVDSTLWECVIECWNLDSAKRPPINDVITTLDACLNV
ncbi:hypothetical protein FA15DRAFT_673452 [Coprinopsis marcescibilis]|uniref:Protein kinase domain-containing protein n=1 Tax=Coprinopsis marcescibilis TaxID=230819 RepID=A0A5C3KJW1_COPMA|nr:hypothetical protein FA15DRAFT_673452 [Coprinopsis marcescibilis]